MRQVLILTVISTVSSLKCKDIIIGTANGTSFNFVNTLRCPPESKWCINMNVSFHSPVYSIEGLFGNCDSSGFIGALLNFTKPMVDLSCKTVGWESYPEANATRYCCNTDLCNSSTIFSVLIPVFVLALFQLL